MTTLLLAGGIIVTALLWVWAQVRGRRKAEVERDAARGERDVAVEQGKADHEVDRATAAGLAAGAALVDTPEIRKAEGVDKIKAIDARLRERAGEKRRR